MPESTVFVNGSRIDNEMKRIDILFRMFLKLNDIHVL